MLVWQFCLAVLLYISLFPWKTFALSCCALPTNHFMTLIISHSFAFSSHLWIYLSIRFPTLIGSFHDKPLLRFNFWMNDKNYKAHSEFRFCHKWLSTIYIQAPYNSVLYKKNCDCADLIYMRVIQSADRGSNNNNTISTSTGSGWCDGTRNSEKCFLGMATKNTLDSLVEAANMIEKTKGEMISPIVSWMSCLAISSTGSGPCYQNLPLPLVTRIS